jgi:zinc resistance-associated protein
MWKKAVVGAAALMIAGSMVVYAQQRAGGPGGGFGDQGRWRLSVEDMSAFADARIAALHAGLKLNADQEKSWPAFEQALRDFAKMRTERFAAARAEQQPAASPVERNPIERLQRRADAMTTRGTALKHLADSATPLYQSLDDAQKHRFAMLARFMRPHPDHAMWRGQPGGPGGFGMRGGEFRFGQRRFGGDDGMRGEGMREGMRGDGMHEGMRGDGMHEGMRGDGMHEGMRGPRGPRDDDYRGPL